MRVNSNMSAEMDNFDDLKEEDIDNICKMSGNMSPRSRLETEKRLRREIANSNERRRMQSINSGFLSLKSLLPRKDGEKMSKASILQQTSDYILQLQTENAQLIQKNLRFQQLLESKENGSGGGQANSPTTTTSGAATCEAETVGTAANLITAASNATKNSRPNSNHHEPLAPPKKRKKFEATDSSDEGIGVMSDGDYTDRGASPRLVSSQQHQQGPNASSAAHSASSHVSVDSNGNSPHCAFETTPVAESKSNGASKIDPTWGMELVQRQLIDLRMALERERRSRLMLEDHLRSVEINSRLQGLQRGTPAASLAASTNPTFLTSSGISSLLSLSSAGGPLSNFSLSAPMQMSPKHNCTSPSVLGENFAALSCAHEGGADGQLFYPQARRGSEQLGGIGDIPTLSHHHHRLLQSSHESLGIPPNSSAAAANFFPPLLVGTSATKQNLEAIVEAIRHLEGDRLFVETGGKPTASANGCENDSGVSSPVTDRLAAMMQDPIAQLVAAMSRPHNISSAPTSL